MRKKLNVIFILGDDSEMQDSLLLDLEAAINDQKERQNNIDIAGKYRQRL